MDFVTTNVGIVQNDKFPEVSQQWFYSNGNILSSMPHDDDLGTDIIAPFEDSNPVQQLTKAVQPLGLSLDLSPNGPLPPFHLASQFHSVGLSEQCLQRFSSLGNPLDSMAQDSLSGSKLVQTVTKRRRIDKRPPGMHNKYGRTGNLRCYECRKRNSKCNYASIWLPCQFCTSRGTSSPCIKLPGPKTAQRLAALAPSKPVVTAIDATIESEDVLLLSYVYTGDSQFTDLVAFSTSLAATDEFGFSLRDLSLRHAVLSMAASDLDPKYFQEKAIQHKAKAWGSLIRKIQNPVFINEADVFASCILAMLAWETGCDQELKYHVNGCLALIKYLDEVPSRLPSTAFQVFKPYVLQWMDYLTTIANLSRWPMAGQNNSFPCQRERITFNERVEIFSRFLQIGVPQRVWYAGTVDALHDTLTDCLQTLSLCIYRIADKERFNDPTRDSAVLLALSQVTQDLEDVNLQTTVQKISKSISTTPTAPHAYKEQLEIYQMNQIAGIELARTLLQSTSILEGLSCFEANYRSKELLSSYRRQGLKPNQTIREFDWLSYPGNLLLAAMALAPGETELKTWVVNELGELPSPLSPEPLRTFWKIRSIEAVVEVLKPYVRVPETQIIGGS